jgi:DNA replicative helicase MCM subunit Mcm2 (Cdc46/Mcm family)
MMKRITITLDEEMYLKLLDYSLDRSKAEFRNVSTSESIRELLQLQMRKMVKVGGKVSRDFDQKVGNLDHN